MKKKIKEQHKLPLTFKYVETFNIKKSEKNIRKDIIYFTECKKYQTDYYVREKPAKPLIRML